jgi:hypothetical protein
MATYGIITYRNSDKYRKRNFDNCIARYLGEFDQVIVVHEGSQPLYVAGNLRFVKFQERDDGLFHKTSMYNLGVVHLEEMKGRMDPTDIVAFVDTDCIVATERPLADIFREGLDKYSIYHPFDAINYLNEQQTDEYISGNLRKLPDFPHNQPMRINRYTGGVVAVEYRTFVGIGGYDLDIVGWGCEDDAFHFKAKQFEDRPAGRAAGITCIHMYHPTAQTSPWVESEGYSRNVKCMRTLLLMTKMELRLYCKGNRSFLSRKIALLESRGYLDLYACVEVAPGSLVTFDVSKYDIPVSRGTKVSLEELMQSILRVDGPLEADSFVRALKASKKELSMATKEILRRYEIHQPKKDQK